MPSPYLITCSCGRRTQIHWNGQRYFALSSNWTATYPEGWTCGRAGHTQRAPPRPIQPAPTELGLII